MLGLYSDKMYIVSYYEEDMCHCVFQVEAESEEEARQKAENYMEENDIGYHYWEDFFRISRQRDVKTIK